MTLWSDPNCRSRDKGSAINLPIDFKVIRGIFENISKIIQAIENRSDFWKSMSGDLAPLKNRSGAR